MFRFIIKRLLIAIPTLLVISWLAFSLSVISDKEPEELKRGISSMSGDGMMLDLNDPSKMQSLKRDRERFNLHLPLFYFAVRSRVFPDTIYRIYDASQREMAQRLAHRCGNWEAYSAYRQSVEALYLANESIGLDTGLYEVVDRHRVQNLRTASLGICSRLRISWKPDMVEKSFHELARLIDEHPVLQPLGPRLIVVREEWAKLERDQTLWKRYMPAIHFYGLQNQYHQWLWAIVSRLDFGHSWSGNQPVSQRFGQRIFWSAMLAVSGLILAYLISIPLGLLMAARANSRFDRVSGAFVMFLNAMPAFFVATMLLIFFANQDMLQWFPSTFSGSLNPGADENMLQVFFRNLHRLALPLVAYTYGAVAYLSRTMRISVLENLQQDFIRTARAKGLSEKLVVGRHALRNSLLPLITLFAGVFPAAIGGSIVLEEIFGIPGMGKEAFDAMHAIDIPMILAIFTVTGFLTIVGYLVSDILLALADPRIRLW